MRSAVYARAGAKCECCGQFMNGAAKRNLYSPSSRELDHVFGRRNAPATAENCWALRRECHRAKSENRPDAKTWLLRFIGHCGVHGYGAARDQAEAKLAWLRARRGVAA